MRKEKNEKGQVMVLTSIIIGALILSASAIAGLLMFFQIQQSNDAVTSGMAVFAADAGIEASFDCYYHTDAGSIFPAGYDGTQDICPENGTLSNGATYISSMWCVDSTRTTRVSCLDNANVFGFRVRSIGASQRTERALETFYRTRFN